MGDTISLQTSSGSKVTYHVEDVSINFRGWNDSVGSAFFEKSKRHIYDFNNQHKEVWSKIKSFPEYNPKAFEYQSMADMIYRLEAK